MHCRQILAHMNPCGPSVQKEVQPRMAKISANYEVVFIMDGRLPEEQVAALTEKFKTLVEQNSTAMEVEEWGKRKLAYAINYITEGYYVPSRARPISPRNWTVSSALPMVSSAP